MFVTPAYAQSLGGGSSDMLMTFFPIILIFVIMYFLVLRPQRQQAKNRQAMLAAIRRNDTVVTGGGLVGKVTKVYEDSGELEVEVAPNTRLRVVRSMIADVRVKGDPAK
jgi:preprotein translocase subunit YajC